MLLLPSSYCESGVSDPYSRTGSEMLPPFTLMTESGPSYERPRPDKVHTWSVSWVFGLLGRMGSDPHGLLAISLLSVDEVDRDAVSRMARPRIYEAPGVQMLQNVLLLIRRIGERSVGLDLKP